MTNQTLKMLCGAILGLCPLKMQPLGMVDSCQLICRNSE